MKKAGTGARASDIFKDAVIIVVFLGICVYLGIEHFQSVPKQGIGLLIQQILLTFLGYVGLISICESKGWTPFVPSFILGQKEAAQKEAVARHMEQYFENDIGYITRYDKDRMNYFISKLGLSSDYIDKVRLDVIKLRMKELKTLDDAREKIKSIIRCERAVVDQREYDSAELTYKAVTYFVNLMDLMFMPPFSAEMTEAMTLLIMENAPLDSFDKIVIPCDSNFLLGFELGKRLSKPIVIMRQSEGKIIRSQRWDGVLEPKDRVIIVHDVLVSGAQVRSAIDSIYPTCKTVAFFCLIKRKEWDGKRGALEKNLPIYSLLDIKDKDILELRNAK